MRIGAIFARGSCRALKWTALLGVVFALAAGTAAAQNTSGVTITGPTKNKVTEGGTATYTVTVRAYVDKATDADTPTAANTVTVSLEAPRGAGVDNGTSAGEPGTDLRLARSSLTVSFETPRNTSTAAKRFFTASGTITLVTEQDRDAEDERFSLAFTLDATGGLEKTATGDDDAITLAANDTVPTGTLETYKPSYFIIDDDETQTYELSLSPTSKPTEGASGATGPATLATVNIKAVPEHVNDSQPLSFFIKPTAGFTLTATGETNKVTVGTSAASVSVSQASESSTPRANRKADTVTLSAYIDKNAPAADEFVDSLEIEFKDIHELPLVKLVVTDENGTDIQPQPTSVKEGESIYVKANVVDAKGLAAATTEALTISLAASGGSADGADIVNPRDLKIDAANSDSGTTPVKLEIRSDEDVGMETLVLEATVSGEDANGKDTSKVPNVLSIDIEDATTTQVEPKSDTDLAAAVKTAMADAEADGEGFNPGESFTVTGSDLFEATEGYVFGLGVSVSGDMEAVRWTSAAAGGVTVTAKQAGEATVTVTATARESSATGSQDVSNVAHVDIPVTVTNKKLLITLEADPAKSVDEGGTITLTAEATRDILDGDNATVTLDVIGSVDSPPESITIPVGEKMATAVLTVKDDSVVEAMPDVTIIASALGTNLFKDYRFDIQVVEDDMATTYELTASAESVAEGGTVMITATASQPVTEDTEIMLVAGGAGGADAADYSLDHETLVFAVGDTEATATLTATADDGVEGAETLTLNAMMGNVLVGSVTIDIEDTDVPPVVEPTIKAKEQADVDKVFMDAGADWTVGDAAVTVDMSLLFVTESTSVAYSASSDNTASVATSHSGGNMLTLTPSEAGDATIKVTATDEASGDVASASSTLTVALQDLTVKVTADSMAIDEGGMATITAMANRKLVAGEDVTLSLTVTGDVAAVEVPDTLTIETGMMTGTATVTAIKDDDTADANVTVVVSGPALGGDTVSLPFAITDGDRTVVAKSDVEVDAVFVLAIGGDFLPGDDAAMLDMGDLFMAEAGADVAYEVMSSNEASVMISANGSMLTLTPGETGSADISVTATDNNGDADDTASVSSTVTVGVLPLKITSVMASATDVMEGDTVEITAMANKAVEANVEVRLMRDGASTAGDDDFEWDATAGVITIMAGDSSGKATLTVENDTDTEPAETLTLLATHADLGQVGTVMITIAASDPMSMFTLSGPMDTNLVEGQSYELTVTADPAVQEDTEVPVMRDRAASDADDADFTVAAVMLKAGDASGTTMLMVADDGMDDSGHGMPEALVLYIADGGANQRLSFNIWDAAVPALPVIAQLLLAAFLAIGGYRRYLRR